MADTHLIALRLHIFSPFGSGLSSSSLLCPSLGSLAIWLPCLAFLFQICNVLHQNIIHFRLKACSAGVCPAGGSRSMSGETPDLHKSLRLSTTLETLVLRRSFPYNPCSRKQPACRPLVVFLRTFQFGLSYFRGNHSGISNANHSKPI